MKKMKIKGTKTPAVCLWCLGYAHMIFGVLTIKDDEINSPYIDRKVADFENYKAHIDRNITENTYDILERINTIFTEIKVDELYMNQNLSDEPTSSKIRFARINFELKKKQLEKIQDIQDLLQEINLFRDNSLMLFTAKANLLESRHSFYISGAAYGDNLQNANVNLLHKLEVKPYAMPEQLCQYVNEIESKLKALKEVYNND